jgi:hypothetical protein
MQELERIVLLMMPQPSRITDTRVIVALGAVRNQKFIHHSLFSMSNLPFGRILPVGLSQVQDIRQQLLLNDPTVQPLGRRKVFPVSTHLRAPEGICPR